jgi:hypothetical protein
MQDADADVTLQDMRRAALSKCQGSVGVWDPSLFSLSNGGFVCVNGPFIQVWA